MKIHDVIAYIRSDYFRYEGREASFMNLIGYTFRNHCFAYTFYLRCSKIRNGLIWRICRYKLKRMTKRYGLEISPTTKIGMGLYIGHGFCIIINPSATIGSNVNLSQMTTIGTNDGNAATIGDGVYIGPGVNIVGPVNIGNGVTIGAGAVVVKDVPVNTTVAGVPAKPISQNTPMRYIQNFWTIKAL